MPTAPSPRPAPDFALPTDDGTIFRLADQRGQPVVLFFYPADDTEGCTTQNRAFSALLTQFVALGAVVVGISPDSVEKHRRFRDKHQLRTALASDPEHVAIDAFGVWRLKKNYGREYEGLVRTSFIVAPDGTIAAEIPAPRINGHAEKVLAALTTLSNNWSSGTRST